MGHVVTAEGVSLDPDKVARIKQWPTPVTVEQLRSFLGMASYYRRYVEGFSKIGTKAGKMSPPFVWLPEADTAVDALKKTLSETPVLAIHVLTGILSLRSMPRWLV